MRALEFIVLPYALSGFGVGFVVGLTGVGGGSLMTPLLVLLFGFHPATAVGTDLLYASVTKTCGTAVHHIGQTRRVAGSWLARRGQPTSEPPYTAADLAPAAQQQRGGEPDFIRPRLRAAVVGAKPSVPTPYIGVGPFVVVTPQAAKRSRSDCTFGRVTRCARGAIVGRSRSTRCHDARVALPAPSNRTDHWN